MSENIKEIIQKAVQLDTAKRFMEATYYYKRGVEQLQGMVPDVNDPAKRRVYLERIQEYMERSNRIAERIRSKTAQGARLASINVHENSEGHSYETMFSEYFTADLIEMQVEETYLTRNHQFFNLVHLCELAVRSATRLNYINVVTKMDQSERIANQEKIQQLTNNLRNYGVKLNVEYDDSLHDRKIILNNGNQGFVIKGGRGLDIYKQLEAKFNLGQFDFNFRKCVNTEFDIFAIERFFN